MKNTAISILSSVIILMIIWLMLGYNSGEGDPSRICQGIILGLIVAVLLALLLGRIFSPPAPRIFSPVRWFWTIIYLPYFFWYCLLSNLDVLYRVIHPRMPINPGIVKVRTGLKSPAAITVLCNSITLTPGTLTIDLKMAGEGGDEDTYLYIHWIDVKAEDIEGATEKIVYRFERILKKIFE